MPIRTATLRHQLEKNGARLHAAMLLRAQSRGADQPPSEDELALQGERRKLKEERAKRQAQAKLPKAKPVRVVKEVKPTKAPKAPKAPKETKAGKDPAKDAKDAKPHHKGPHLSRTELHAKKAEALKAAEQAAKKSAAVKKGAKS
jgi:hypothetical protein